MFASVHWFRSFVKASIVIFLCGLCFPTISRAQTSEQAVVLGEVVDDDGAPISFVNVQVAGTTDGAATGRDGHFDFVTRNLGRQVLQATMIGFEPARRALDLSPGDTATVRLVLRETLITLDEVEITASAYSTGEAETVTLQSLEVVTTPGSAADIFRTIKTFPGVSMVDEGSGLFVRGGDVSETVILLDQATLTHPYKFESPTGGVFGIIPPFMVRGTVFSSGGFSARYGNALSAVLSMDSQNMPLQQNYSFNLGLAAASLGFNVPVVPGKLGLRFTGNRSFTGLMFRLNGQLDQFPTPPRGYDGNLSIVYQYSPTGRIKFFNFTTDDRLGVHVNQPSFDGVYRGQTTSWLHNIQWTDIYKDWLLQTSASLNRYKAHQQLGNLNLEPGDDTYKLRADVERDLHERARVRLGAELERTRSRFRGTSPFQEDILDPAADVFKLDEVYSATRIGAYAEVETKPARRIAVNTGVRMDYHNLASKAVVDPRVSLHYALSKNTDVRLAWGLYHQFAAPFEYNNTSGNPALGPQRAQHFIAGLSYERNLLMLRAEAYHKPYHHLILHHPDLNYTNGGEGTARGLDVFAKYGAFLQTRFNGWVAYSFLESRRVQPRHLGREVIYERAPSPFDITHNLTIVAKMRLIGFLSSGLTFRHATGRPVTPVVGALAEGNGSYFLPIEGAVGSERLPDFQRLDASLSYFLPFGEGHNITFYFSVGNLLNQANVIDYEYSADYTERGERTTNYRRFLYFGTTLNLNR